MPGRARVIGKRFLGETFVPTRVCFALGDRQYPRSCTSLPSPEIPISHRFLVQCRNPTAPLPCPGSKPASLTPKKSIDSGTHSEPL